jgi:hypothetical protein
MEIIRILGILAFIAIPILFLLKANALKSERLRKINEEIEEMTFCKTCGKKDYQVNCIYERIGVNNPGRAPSYWLTSTTYTIICRGCNQIIGTKKFDSKEESEYYLDEQPYTKKQTDVPIKGLITHLNSPGCGEVLLRILSWIFIIGYLATIIYGLAIQ